MIFDSAGKLIAFRRTGNIKSTQMLDIDEDGQDEIITDEIDGTGTGIGRDGYHIYRLGNNKLEQLWHGESYYLDAFPGQHVERQGFIRFMESGWGVPLTRLVHTVCNINGKKWHILMADFMKSGPNEISQILNGKPDIHTALTTRNVNLGK